MKGENMKLQPTEMSWRYGRPAIFLHWVLALLIAGLVGLGWYMMSIEEEPNSGWYFDLHKSTGIVVFSLVLLRVLWRSKHRPAALPASLPAWQIKVSSVTQWSLYACMVLMPLTGFIGASYSKKGVVFFGLKVPAWGVPNHDIAEQFFSVHSALAWLLVALVTLHAAAGLKHLLIDKDGVFQRM
jgi:cytochrome b561